MKRMKILGTLSTIALSVALLAACAGAPATGGEASAAPVASKSEAQDPRLAYTQTPAVLKIIEVSDLHGKLFQYNFKTGAMTDTSLSQVSTVLKEERAKKDQQVVFLDCGDNLQGQPIIYYYNFVKTDVPSPYSKMMNWPALDAAAVGNHDVETGHSVYDKVRKELKAPMLSANIVTDDAAQKPYFEPYTILNKGGIKIAVIGLTEPAFVLNFPKTLYAGMKPTPLIEAAEKTIKLVQEKEKPDLIIGLFHAGVDWSYRGGKRDDPMNESLSEVVAETVPGFDLILVGHDHQGWDGRGYDPATKAKVEIKGPDGTVVPIYGAIDDAKAIPVITATMKWDAEKKSWEKSITGELKSMKDVPVDPDFMKTFDAELKEATEWANRPIGKTTKQVSARDAMFGDSEFVDTIHQLQLLLSADPSTGLKKADVSFCAPLDMNMTVPASADLTLRVRDMFSLYRYENWLFTMKLTGKQIKDSMEFVYGAWFDTMKSDKDQLILFQKDAAGAINTDPRTGAGRTVMPSYNWDSFAGIKYTVDVTKPAGSRVTVLSMADGSPFSMDKTYIAAINSYRAMGGGGILTQGAGISKQVLIDQSLVVGATDKDLRFYLTKAVEAIGGTPITPYKYDNWKVIPESLWKAGMKNSYPLLFPSK